MTGKIVIGGKEYLLRYGMGAVKIIGELGTKELELWELGAEIIHAAHLCYCSSRKLAPSLAYHEVLDFVEIAFSSNNEADLEQITSAINGYNESTVVKDLIKVGIEAEDKKKALTLSQTTNDLPTGSLD